MRAGLSLSLLALVAACGGGRDGVTYAALQNANLESEHVEGGRLTLVDGIYEAATGSGQKLRTVLRGEALGDVDGDGVTDGVLVIATNAGAGPILDLALVVDRAGQPIHAATMTLGARVQLSGVAIEDKGIVRVDLREHAEGDAPEAPSRATVRRFAFQGGRLIER